MDRNISGSRFPGMIENFSVLLTSHLYILAKIPRCSFWPQEYQCRARTPKHERWRYDVINHREGSRRKTDSQQFLSSSQDFLHPFQLKSLYLVVPVDLQYSRPRLEASELLHLLARTFACQNLPLHRQPRRQPFPNIVAGSPRQISSWLRSMLQLKLAAQALAPTCEAVPTCRNISSTAPRSKTDTRELTA
jgi:hypothetical protein